MGGCILKQISQVWLKIWTWNLVHGFSGVLSTWCQNRILISVEMLKLHFFFKYIGTRTPCSRGYGTKSLHNIFLKNTIVKWFWHHLKESLHFLKHSKWSLWHQNWRLQIILKFYNIFKQQQWYLLHNNFNPYTDNSSLL